MSLHHVVESHRVHHPHQPVLQIFALSLSLSPLSGSVGSPATTQHQFRSICNNAGLDAGEKPSLFAHRYRFLYIHIEIGEIYILIQSYTYMHIYNIYIYAFIYAK